MADAGPPLVLMALGLILWLAVNATLAGISIQTIGIILFLVGVVWLLIELVQSRRSPVAAAPSSFAKSRSCASARSTDIRATISPAPSPGAGERPWMDSRGHPRLASPWTWTRP